MTYDDDLGPNKQRLIEVASTALPDDVLVDLGVRYGASSAAMLFATLDQGCKVIGVDPDRQMFGYHIPRYTYLQTDSVSAAEQIPAPIYLCFFDTLHIKQQVMAELFHYWPKIRVGGWAVFHDSEWGEKRDHYLGQDWPPVMDGIEAFFGYPISKVPKLLPSELGAYGRTRNFTFEHYSDSYGMTFIQKLADWNPSPEGMVQALEDSAHLTKHVCG